MTMLGNVLMFSQRRIARLVAYCLVYEFEDVVKDVTDAERIDVEDFQGVEFSRRAYKLFRKSTGSVQVARTLAPRPRDNRVLQRDYDLFFAAFSHVYELYSLATITNWRQRCAKTACFITEAWPNQLPDYLLEILGEFDHIFVGGRLAVEDIARLTGRPCSYLPLAADVVRFAPRSPDAPRPIDVCNIGRRSEITHKALLDLVEADGAFYYFDTVAASGSDLKDRTFRVDDPREHRYMLANILKRSRFYITNRGHINNPAITAEHDSISARFYEGAAAGTIMIGVPPRTPQFSEEFDWPDANIPMPFDSPDIGEFLAQITNDSDRMRSISARNICQAALKHDWLHRIQSVFDTLGVPATEKMQARAKLLNEIISLNECAAHSKLA